MTHRDRIASVSKSVANDFFARYEHLGNVGLGVWHWGLFIEGILSAVVSFGTTCFSNTRGWLSEVAKQENVTIVQLCRGGTAPWAPKGTASRIISLACSQMHQLRGPLIVVAYSDVQFCEIGTIYQACNAVYTGLTDPKGQANYVINGKILSGWKVRKFYGTRDRTRLKAIDPDCKVLNLHPKHRYVLISAPPKVRKALRRALLPFSLPYPKREILGVPSMCPVYLRHACEVSESE